MRNSGIISTSTELSSHENAMIIPSCRNLQSSDRHLAYSSKAKMNVATTMLWQSCIRGVQIRRTQLQQGPSCTRDCLFLATLSPVALQVSQLCKSVTQQNPFNSLYRRAGKRKSEEDFKAYFILSNSII